MNLKLFLDYELACGYSLSYYVVISWIPIENFWVYQLQFLRDVSSGVSICNLISLRYQLKVLVVISWNYCGNINWKLLTRIIFILPVEIFSGYYLDGGCRLEF